MLKVRAGDVATDMEGNCNVWRSGLIDVGAFLVLVLFLLATWSAGRRYVERVKHMGLDRLVDCGDEPQGASRAARTVLRLASTRRGECRCVAWRAASCSRTGRCRSRRTRSALTASRPATGSGGHSDRPASDSPLATGLDRRVMGSRYFRDGISVTVMSG